MEALFQYYCITTIGLSRFIANVQYANPQSSTKWYPWRYPSRWGCLSTMQVILARHVVDDANPSFDSAVT